MDATKLWGNSPVLAVADAQFGDTGKGKLIDILTERARLIVRSVGGANAGHTVSHDGQTVITHLIPSSVTHPDSSKKHLIGSGVAFEPAQFLREVDEIKALDLDPTLLVSHKAKLVLPTHVLLDNLREQRQGSIGTTGRGIGPCYADHVARVGLMVGDLFLPKSVLLSKLERHLHLHEDELDHVDSAFRATCFAKVDPDRVVADALNQQDLAGSLLAWCQHYGHQVARFITDTDALVRTAYSSGDPLLLEGAQGLLLSVDHGTRPFVTSSDCSPAGIIAGSGLPFDANVHVLSTVKAFYMTRVGDGPFPTEYGRGFTALGQKAYDGRFIHDPRVINDPDCTQPLRGAALRVLGHEYGATTGRPRRTGALDLPLLRYALPFMGSGDVVLMKVDVMSSFPVIDLCVGYRYSGPDTFYAGAALTSGSELQIAIPEPSIMDHCKPIYERFPGWLSDIKEARSHWEIPEKVRVIIDRIVNLTGINVRAISVGRDREQTVVV